MALNKVTVRIWMPHNMGFIGDIASSLGVGHASITLVSNDRKYYITWMADGHPLRGVELDPYNHIGTFNKAGDQRNMQGFFNSPDPAYKIKLKTKQPNSQGEGLDAELIERFWLDRLQNMPKYSFFSLRNNCTGCVADALRAGGIEQYVPSPTNWFVQDARSLYTWVSAASNHLGPADDKNA